MVLRLQLGAERMYDIAHMYPVQPFTNLFDLRLQFLVHFPRHPRRLVKIPEHVGLALFRTGDGPFGVLPVTQADGCFGNAR